MNNLCLNNDLHYFSKDIKEIFWQFVRGDMAIKDFELWVYSDVELKHSISEESYLALAMADYKENSEIDDIKRTIYKFLTRFSESCICSSFPNYALLYPFTDNSKLQEHIEQLKVILQIPNCCGTHLIHQSRYYHPAEICCCTKCNTWSFVIFEETEGSDYYLVRLTDEEASVITQFPNWPNERWPLNLKSWDAFCHLKFQS